MVTVQNFANAPKNVYIGECITLLWIVQQFDVSRLNYILILFCMYEDTNSK
jgi:hypothetical protein